MQSNLPFPIDPEAEQARDLAELDGASWDPFEDYDFEMMDEDPVFTDADLDAFETYIMERQALATRTSR